MLWYDVSGIPVLWCDTCAVVLYLCRSRLLEAIHTSVPLTDHLFKWVGVNPKSCVSYISSSTWIKSGLRKLTFSPAAAVIDGKRIPPLEGGPRMVGTPGTSVSGSKGGNLGPWGPFWRSPGAPALGLGAVGGPGGTGGVGGCFPLPETNFAIQLISLKISAVTQSSNDVSNEN